jgi:hypothetical protein
MLAESANTGARGGRYSIAIPPEPKWAQPSAASVAVLITITAKICSNQSRCAGARVGVFMCVCLCVCVCARARLCVHLGPVRDGAGTSTALRTLHCCTAGGLRSRSTLHGYSTSGLDQRCLLGLSGPNWARRDWARRDWAKWDWG